MTCRDQLIMQILIFFSSFTEDMWKGIVYVYDCSLRQIKGNIAEYGLLSIKPISQGKYPNITDQY